MYFVFRHCYVFHLIFPIILFFFFCFLGLHLKHMEIPRPGVKMELQLPDYTTATATWDLSLVCNPHHSSLQHWILDPLSKARDQTRNLIDPSWIPFPCATTGTPPVIHFYCILQVFPHQAWGKHRPLLMSLKALSQKTVE